MYLCRVLNNAEWWDDVSGVHFVSDITRHFRLSSMLAKERSNLRFIHNKCMLFKLVREAFYLVSQNNGG